MSESHSLGLEHRLTVVEMRGEQHGDRLTALEKRHEKVITPRDWFLIGAGFLTIIAAMVGRINWDQASLILKTLSQN